MNETYATLRQKILACEDIEREDVWVEQWKVKLTIKGLNGLERAQLLSSALGKDGRTNFERIYPELVILTACDPETGKPVFERADRDALNQKAGAALECITQVAMRLSGLSAEAIAATEKNSEAASAD